MTITTFLDPTQMPSQDDDQIPFDNKMAAVLRGLPTFGAEVNATAANLNSIAAGGAYAIPYTWGLGVNSAIGFDVGGKIALGNGADNNATNVAPANATIICVDTKDSGGLPVSASLVSTTAGNASVLKGHIRVVKVGEPSKWARFAVKDFGLNSALYGTFFVNFIESSVPNPFAAGDAVMLFFQRTGDKGDTGPLNVYPMLHVRDEKASGTAPGSSTNGATVTRVFNTVKKNTVTGASLASNQITLPAGTFRFRGSAPAMTDRHQAQLYNVTGAAVLHVGTSEYSSLSGGYAPTRSHLNGEIVLTGSTVIELRHYTQTAGGLGLAAGSGQVEVYSEMIFEKVA
jgi:hypothetical protein